MWHNCRNSSLLFASSLSRSRPCAPEPRIAVGCCGWGEGRAKYYTHFPIVELQSTFYDPPTDALASKWRASAPADFRFCMKAWQLITHTPASPTYRRLRNPIAPSERELFGSFRATDQVRLAWQKTREIATLLRAEVILFQCPASFTPVRENIQNFRRFFKQIGSPDARLAWEPRGDWPGELIRELCAEFNLIHCVDPFQSKALYGDRMYWRLHGRDSYFYTYTDTEIEWLAARAFDAMDNEQKPVYVLFNNTGMNADALRLQSVLRGSWIAQG